MELLIEKYCVIFVSAVLAVLWRVYGDELGKFIKTDNYVVYQTMLMFSTIVVALMATFKAIILTATSNTGVDLIKSNFDMFERFIGYIFYCIIGNLVFCALCFFLLLVNASIDGSIKSSMLVFLGSFSFLSLLRALILFKIIITKRS